MRRILATVALGAALLTVTACSDKGADSANPTPGASAGVTSSAEASPGATASGGTGSTASAADRKAACDSYRTAQTDLQTKFTAWFAGAAEAMQDSSKAPKAIADLKTLLGNFSATLVVQTATMKDAQLKAAVQADIEALAKAKTSLEAAGSDMNKATAVLQDESFQKIGSKVQEMCGF